MVLLDYFVCRSTFIIHYCSLVCNNGETKMNWDWAANNISEDSYLFWNVVNEKYAFNLYQWHNLPYSYGGMEA